MAQTSRPANGHRRLAADTVEGAVFEEAQQLRLELQVELADLVEEEDAVPRAFGVAEMPSRGAGEGAAFVAEQLALQEVLRNGGAVHGDERPRLRAAQPVQVAGADLLADAGLAR